MMIVYVVSSLEEGGPTQVLFDLTTTIKRKGIDLKIITLSKERKKTSFQLFADKGIDIITLDLNRVSFFLYGRKKLYNCLKRINSNIVHTMGVRADYGVSKLKLFRKKQISTIHCFAEEEYKYVYGRILGALLTKMQIFAMNHMNVPICCSLSIEKKYKNSGKIFNQRLTTIQNGIDISNYSRNNEKLAKRRCLDLPLDKEIFLFVGRLTPHKNPILVIESFEKANRNNAILVLLGDGILKEKVFKMKNDKVFAMGKVNNVNEYLECADFFVSASLTEGLPLSVIEAGVSGKTLILSNIDQHYEIVDASFPGVFYFNPSFPGDLENAFLLVKKENDDFIQDYFIKKFSSERMSDEYLALYHEIIDN